MASVSSSTSSLGNTSLRGYGGMASGIDRDAIIEQMTAGTQQKITNKQSAVTSLTWKQEAYRSISDKIIDMEDNYFSFAGGLNLKYSSSFEKNQVSVVGDEDSTQFIKATGTSSMIDYLSILGVASTATSATRISDSKGSGAINTSINDLGQDMSVTKLQGRKLTFGIYDETSKAWSKEVSFTFPSTYKVTEEGADGQMQEVTKEIDYTSKDPEKIVEQLNLALKDGLKLDDDGTTIQLSLKDDKLQMTYGKYINIGDEEIFSESRPSGDYVIRNSSTALSALGFKSDGIDTSDGISLDEFNQGATNNTESFRDSAVYPMDAEQYLTDSYLSVTYNGQTKDVKIMDSEDLKELRESNEYKIATPEEQKKMELEEMAAKLQKRMDKAFGSNKIAVEINKDGNLSFNTKDSKQSLTISSDDYVLRDNLGIPKNASTKICTNTSILDNMDRLGFDLTSTVKEDDYTTDGVLDQAAYDAAVKEELNAQLANFKINGVKIEGLTADTTVDDMISKINNTKDVGVKASYLSQNNQFVLVATETGTGRNIQLEGGANTIFGGGQDNDGKDAVMTVSYGNGLITEISSSTNTFNVEGLSVTVSGSFGYKTVTEDDGSGNQVERKVLDTTQSSKAVSFKAKADVDGVTEKVKKFFEDFNALVTEINKQTTTRPDSDYGPLTDEQKEEMDEKSIENWENKAKEGILYGDSTMRELSLEIQGVLSQLLSNGVYYEDLKRIGITMSDDYLDGGTIIFDETKFKEAMENEPETVSNIFAGGNGVKKGLASTMEDMFTKYATRYAKKNGNSYGRLIEEAGSEKVPSSLQKNQIYEQLKEMQKQIDAFKEQLQTEQDRYIKQFTTMETLINQMNSQSSYLSSLQM